MLLTLCVNSTSIKRKLAFFVSRHANKRTTVVSKNLRTVLYILRKKPSEKVNKFLYDIEQWAVQSYWI